MNRQVCFCVQERLDLYSVHQSGCSWLINDVYVNHTRFSSWNQSILNLESKVFCLEKEQCPLMGFELTNDRIEGPPLFTEAWHWNLIAYNCIVFTALNFVIFKALYISQHAHVCVSYRKQSFTYYPLSSQRDSGSRSNRYVFIIMWRRCTVKNFPVSTYLQLIPKTIVLPVFISLIRKTWWLTHFSLEWHVYLNKITWIVTKTQETVST